jgi:hypothetical protein
VLPTASRTLAEIFIILILPEYQELNWKLFFASNGNANLSDPLV